MSWPAAEVTVDEEMVRGLLHEQHPDLAGLPLVELGAGWDNVLWRLGADLLVRLPRRESAAALVENEQRWLPTLAPRLPVPVPAPVRVGRMSARFAWPWSVVPWLEGQPADLAALTRPDDAAARLGRFLRALHRVAPAAAPHNPWRGVPLEDRTDTVEQRLAELAGEVDEAGVRRVWNRALTAERFSGRRRWLHGDLHPANVLLVDGTLAAVVDFGDLCGGDPATDLAGAVMLLPAASLDGFARAYGGIDDGLGRRTLGWATLFGLMLLEIGLRDRPSYATVGRRTLASALVRSDADG